MFFLLICMAGVVNSSDMPKFGTIEWGTRLNVPSLQDIHDVSFRECANTCLEQNVCYSFNYCRIFLWCQINGYHESATIKTQEQAFIYSDISTWGKVVRNCSSVVCQYDEECRMVTTGPVCFEMEYADSKGKDFMIAYTEKITADVYNQPSIFISYYGSSAANANLTSPLTDMNRTKIIQSGSSVSLKFAKRYHITGTDKTLKGILIQSDREVTVCGQSSQLSSGSAFLALPTDTLGTQYYVLAPYPASSHTIIVLVARNPSVVSIQLPTNPVSTQTLGAWYKAGSTFRVELNKSEAIQINGEGDLSGTKISSDQPIAIFSGNIITESGTETTEDNAVEQLPPISTWGRMFVVFPVPNSSSAVYVKLISNQDDTQIDWHCTTNSKLSFSTTLPVAGTVHEEHITSGYCYLESSKEILAVEIIQDQQTTSASSMFVVTPVEQYSKGATFETPQSIRNNVTTPYTNYLMLVANEADIAGFSFDGDVLDTSWFNTVPVLNYKAGFVEIADGTHTLSHSTNANFAAFLYGVLDKESYAMPINMGMQILNMYNMTS